MKLVHIIVMMTSKDTFVTINSGVQEMSLQIYFKNHMKSDTKPLLAWSVLVIIHPPTSNHDHIVNREAYFAPLNEERPLTFSSLYRILIVP